jgi:hypothetical protein
MAAAQARTKLVTLARPRAAGSGRKGIGVGRAHGGQVTAPWRPRRRRVAHLARSLSCGTSPAELRARLERDAERAKRMLGGAHLQDWPNRT